MAATLLLQPVHCAHRDRQCSAVPPLPFGARGAFPLLEENCLVLAQNKPCAGSGCTVICLCWAGRKGKLLNKFKWQPKGAAAAVICDSQGKGNNTLLAAHPGE